MAEFAVTISPGPKNNTLGTRTRLDAQAPAESLRQALQTVSPGRESWWSPHTWTNDRRAQAAWESAVGIAADIDYIDAAGEHSIQRPEDRSRFEAAATTLPGTLYHLTPRGFRVVAVFAEPCADAQLWTSAAEAFGGELGLWLKRNRLDADRGAHLAGYEVDSSVLTDRARFLYGPRSLVSGIQRSAAVEILRLEPTDPAALAALRAPPPAPKPAPVRSSQAASRFEDAAIRYNQDRTRDWGKSGSGRCPACGHKGCFGRLKDSETRWACFSSNHPDACGTRGANCHTGDALDIDSFTANRSPADHLRAEGYLLQRPAFEEPPPPSDEDMPPELRGELAQVVPIRGAAQPPADAPPAKPVIRVTADEEDVNDQAVSALARDPRIFQRGRRLVQVLRGVSRLAGVQRSPDALTISEIPLARLREMMAASARWEKAAAAAVPALAATGTGNAAPEPPRARWQRTHPPAWAIQAVHVRERWGGIRPLEGVIEWPVLRQDGTILADPGYDERTGLYYEPAGRVDPVAQEPSVDEVVAAVELLREAVCDFPFAGADQDAPQPAFSAWLAALLTPLSRYAFDGPAPLFLAEASTRGSGKTLLWELVSTILTGRSLASTPYAEKDEEMAKKITACALAGDSLIFLDNVRSTFGGGALDQALTGRTWRDRILGQSANTPELPLNATWYATGNNLLYIGDIERRMCVCRLESQLECPEDREAFRHPELLAWARQERHRLLAAALTILRAYAVAGRPRGKGKLWGSYEGWSRTVKCAIEWLGLPEPPAPRHLGAVTGEAEELGALMAALRQFDPDARGISAAELLRVIEHEQKDAKKDNRELDVTVQALVDALGGFPLPNSHKLGNRFRKWRGRVMGGRKLVGVLDDHSKSILWSVRGAVQSDLPLVAGTAGTAGTCSGSIPKNHA